MATEQVELSKLFSQLHLAGEDGDYEWGLDVSNQILKIAPEDPDALFCRIVSLIQLSEYEQALKAIKSLSKGSKEYLYEKAYCQYKLEKYNDSLETLCNLTAEERSSIPVLDLTAQIYYRLENYEKSAQLFRQGRVIEDSQERAANMVAALSYCLFDATSLMSENPVDDNTMELCFNLATLYLNVHPLPSHLDKAIILLRKSEKYCEDINPDDEDFEQEVIPIHVQLAYALLCQGQYEQALSINASVLKKKPSSLVHTITAANNVIVLNRDKDVFDSKKKIKVISHEHVPRKLTSKQQSTIMFNRCLFALQINQLEQCKQLLQELKTLSSKVEEVILVESALLNREKKSLESCEVMEQYIKTTPSCSIVVYLTMAQLCMSQGNLVKVIEALEKIPNVSQYLGVASVLLSLYTSTGANDKCERLLSNAIAYWKESESSPVKEKVLWSIGQYKLRCGSPDEAAVIFEYLYESNKSNVKFLANLISAYSRFNTQKAEELGRQLSQSYSAPLAFDVDSLEQMPSFRHSRRQVVKNEAPKSSGEDAATVKEKKRKRKTKLPKSYDPSKPPDQERWLPLRERSYYRKSKKKGQQTGIGRGTQGMSAASASLAAKLDANKPKSDDVKEATKSPKPKTIPHKKKKKSRR